MATSSSCAFFAGEAFSIFNAMQDLLGEPLRRERRRIGEEGMGAT